MEQDEAITEPAAKKENDPNDAESDDGDDPKDNPAPKPLQTESITPVKVVLTQGYWLGKYEVTQSEWKDVMKTEPWKGNRLTREGADFPATCVSWDDATAFCRKLTDQERKASRLSKDWEYTLPTEAQWERACRARTRTKFSFGDDDSKLGDYAWFAANARMAGENYAHQVGQKKPNPWGLCDMHGNVWEWCRDVFADKLPGGRDPEVKPEEKAADLRRVFRGGDWNDVPAGCRSASRQGLRPISRDDSLGFRVARSRVR